MGRLMFEVDGGCGLVLLVSRDAPSSSQVVVTRLSDAPFVGPKD